MSKPFQILLLLLIIPIFINFGIAQSPMQVAGTATITATTSGNWSSSSTWGGSLPIDDARVLIPNGVTVTVDGIITAAFKSIRIADGGKLRFATNVNTELRTEYLFSAMTGTLEIGTNANKIATNVTANLVFAERGGTTSTFDPERFAPGAVLMGPTTMHGAAKTSWLTLQTHPSAGATQFVLKSAPSGWQVGDKIVVAGTDPITNASISSTAEFEKDEVVTVTGVSGNTVTFTPALVRDHKAPTQASDLEVHVANLSRNIIVSSENTSVTSISGEFRKPRGHLMFMHNLNVDLKYVEANNLGRTDKTTILDDWDFAELARDQNTGSPVPNGGRNPRGRYSFHFHRGGLNTNVHPAKPITPLPTPASVEGCVVNNDPGWGYVNHSSRVDFVKNVSYNVVGGAFNTEAGNETGSFIENIAIRTVNPQNPIMSAPRPRDSYVHGDPTSSLADLKEGRQDFAWQGDGFWLHGTGVTVQGNVVAGCTGHAYVYWVDGLIEKGMGMARGDIDAHVPAADFPTQNQVLKDWKNQYPNFSLDIWYLQARPFANNTAYNFPRGVQTYYVHTELHHRPDPEEADAETVFNDTPPTYKDQLNLIFDNTILWNIGRVGFEHNHTANVTIQNSRIVGYGSRTGFENYGPNPAPDFVPYEPEVIGLDLDYYFNTHRWTLNNNTVEGFAGNAIGIALPINAQVTINGGSFNNSGTDILIGTPSTRLGLSDAEGFGTAMLSTPPTKSTILIQGAINFQNPNKNIVMDNQIIYDAIAQKGFHLLDGPKPDPLYFFAPLEVTLNFGPFQNSTVYFEAQDANFIPIISGNRCTFSDGGEFCVSSQYVGKTNTQLNAQYNNSFLGAITPANAVINSIIVGGKVTNVTMNACSDQGGDVDNDGVCANNDCDDNNPNIGAKQTVGTSCNDGNPMTANDVIQSDGCTCAGTTISNTFPTGAKILCLGDSRVEGATEYESYRYEFWKNLVDCSWNFDLVGTNTDSRAYPTYQNLSFDPNHQGVGGHQTTDVLEELPDALSSIGVVDIVLLGIGGNDALEGGSAAVAAAITNINSIIDLLQANNPNIIILLEQIAPAMSATMTTDLTAALNNFNNQIPTIAANQTSGNSSQVIVVDMAIGWQDSYLADEVHYNATGAAIIATRYSDALKALYTCGTSTSSCPTDYLFNNNNGLTGTAVGTQILETDGHLESTQTIANGANIIYDSKTQITLQAGFHAVAGSTFSAVIEGCSTNTLSEHHSTVHLDNRMTEEENLTNPLSLEKKLEEKALIRVFPNPTTGNFTVDGNFQAAAIQLFTANGQLLKTRVQQNLPFEMDISGLPSGLYFIRAFSEGNEVLMKRIVKKH